MQISLDGRMSASGSVVALGMFDGVHIGHRVLLAKAKAAAVQAGVPMVVHTFAEHPLKRIDPERVPPLLTTLTERMALIEAASADIFSAVAFTDALRDMPPEDFVGHLVQQWKPRAVVVGFNYTFGRKGEGTPHLLHELGHALGFQTYVVPAIQLDGRPVSATIVRGYLMDGAPEQVRPLLGRAYSMRVAVQLSAAAQWLLPLDAEKLAMPVGCYRARLETQNANIPVVVRVYADGRMQCRSTAPIALQGEAQVAFLTAWPRKATA